MRVLFVTHRFPGAAHRGDQARAFAQIQALSQKHELHVLCFEQIETEDPAWARLRPFCASLHTYPRSRLRMLLKAGIALWTKRPLQVAMFDAAEFNAVVRELLDAYGIELMHVQLVRLAGVIEATAGVPIVLDYVDALSRNMAARALKEHWTRRWLFTLESRRLLALERRLLPRLAGAVISASADARDIDPSGAVQVAANGVALDAFDRVPEPAVRAGVVFLGNWAYFPNQHGLLWLLDQVMPKVWQRFPDLTLRLVGANPESIPAKARLPRVEIVGPVSAVAPVLKQAQLAVAPMQSGSGQSLKILEAMAAATPVVASARAAAALSARPDQDLCVGQDAEAFASAMTRLLADPELARQIGQAGSAHVRSEYAWAISHEKVSAVWSAARALA